MEPADSDKGIIVVGPMGAGKSTFLNTLMGENKFETSDGSESCT